MINFILYSNLYVAVGAALVAYVTNYAIHRSALTWEILFLPFANSFFIYTLNRFTDKNEDRINDPMRVHFFARYGTWFLAASATMYGVAFVIALTKGIIIPILLIVPLCVGLLYSFLGLKKIVIVKNLSVGIAWGTTALLVGAFHNRFGFSVWSLFVFFTIECFIASVISDVKDIQGDRLHGISTLPIILGLQRTKYVCYVLNGIALVIAILSAVLRWMPWHGLAVCAMAAYMLAFTYLCNEERGLLFFWVCS